MHVLRLAHPIARKVHTCGFCYRDIPVGERYKDQVWTEYGSLYTWKSCDHCETMIILLDMWAINDGEGLDRDDFFEYEASSIFELRCVAMWKRKWTRKDGTLYPVPARATKPQETNL